MWQRLVILATEDDNENIEALDRINLGGIYRYYIEYKFLMPEKHCSHFN